MPQLPPIDDAYINEIIKSTGPYNESLNKTQGVKLRELMKRFRDYFEQKIPTAISQLTNDTGYLTPESLTSLATKVDLGDKNELLTTDKTNVVRAVNEIVDHVNSLPVDQATELRAGIAKVATVGQAIDKISDTEMMTPAKSGALIADEKKWFKFQVAMTGETEQFILMEYAGEINSSLIGGCNSLKLKIGANGSYPNGTQLYPFAFNAGDKVFFTFNYDDLMFAKCNIILKGKYN